MFSDNIILYCLIPQDVIDSSEDIRKYIQEKASKEAKESKVTKGLTGDDDEANNEEQAKKNSAYNKVIHILKKYLVDFTSNIKRCLNNVGIMVNKPDIKQTMPRIFNDRIEQQIKVSLANIPIEKVFDLISDPKLIEYLKDNNIYINDIDFTRDFAGVFNKQEVIDYMLDEGFAMAGCNEHSDEGFILRNDHLVGGNCLTFITISEYGNIRYKLYNKFVQSIESAGVRKSMGNHIADWCNNPEPVLKQAIDKSLDTGLLRLEITFYRDVYNSTLTRDYINEKMEYLRQLVTPELLYHNPITTQWQLLLQTISYNLLLVDTDNKLALFVYYHNKETGKVNGTYIKEITTNCISNYLKMYSFNVPLAIVLLKREGSNLLFQQDNYIKVLDIVKHKAHANEEPTTFVAKGSEYFRTRLAEQKDKKPQEVGLMDNIKVKLRLQYNKFDIKQTKTSNININFEPYKDIDLTFPKITDTLRNLNKCIKQETDAANFVTANANVLTQVADTNKEEQERANLERQRARQLLEEKNRELVEQLQEKERVNGIKRNILEHLNKPNGNLGKFLDLEDGVVLYVYAAKSVMVKERQAYIVATHTNKKITKDTMLKCYWVTSNVAQHIDKNKANYYEFHNNIYGCISGHYIFAIQKNGTYFNQTRNKCASVRVVGNTPNANERDTIEATKENISQANINIDEIVEAFKKDDGITHIGNRLLNNKNCKPIDSMVKEGDILSITNYWSFNNGWRCAENG
jgi:hypothetical protein